MTSTDLVKEFFENYEKGTVSDVIKYAKEHKKNCTLNYGTLSSALHKFKKTNGHGKSCLPMLFKLKALIKKHGSLENFEKYVSEIKQVLKNFGGIKILEDTIETYKKLNS